VKNWRPADWAVLLLAAALAFMISVNVVATIWRDLSEAKADILAGIIMAIIAIISAYVAGNPKDQDPPS
jgi:uncharacterized membrane protein YoaK (UPF0700 family)